MKITKMQGLGNDYIYVNCLEETVEDPEALSRRISDRHFGVGSDGLVLIMPCEEADFRMRMFNADGSVQSDKKRMMFLVRLCDAVSVGIKNMMSILGIEVPERM